VERQISLITYSSMIIVKNKYKGTGTVVYLRRPGGGQMRIDLDSATPEQLEKLKKIGHPFVQDKPKEAKKKTKDTE
jgi:hypothetical protein